MPLWRKKKFHHLSDHFCFGSVKLPMYYRFKIFCIQKHSWFMYEPFSQDVRDIKWPDIFVCTLGDKIQAQLAKHGYFMDGSGGGNRLARGLTSPNHAAGRSEQEDLITWEGLNNVTYENITGNMDIFPYFYPYVAGRGGGGTSKCPPPLFSSMIIRNTLCWIFSFLSGSFREIDNFII